MTHQAEAANLIISKALEYSHVDPGHNICSNVGKARASHLLRKRSDLRAAVAIYYNKEEIAAAGERFFLARYGVEKFPSLNTIRFFFKLKQMTTKQSLDKVMNLATLPPTSGSVKQHSLRAYLLIQKCPVMNLIVYSGVGRCELMYFF